MRNYLCLWKSLILLLFVHSFSVLWFPGPPFLSTSNVHKVTCCGSPLAFAHVLHPPVQHFYYISFPRPGKFFSHARLMIFTEKTRNGIWRFVLLRNIYSYERIVCKYEEWDMGESNTRAPHVLQVWSSGCVERNRISRNSQSNLHARCGQLSHVPCVLIGFILEDPSMYFIHIWSGFDPASESTYLGYQNKAPGHNDDAKNL